MAKPVLLKGYEATVATDAFGGTTIGKVQNFTISVNNNNSVFFTIGSRLANVIKEGNFVITGTMKLAMTDKTQLINRTVTAATLQPTAGISLYFQVTDGVNDAIQIQVNNLHFNTWVLSGVDNTGAVVSEESAWQCAGLTIT